MPRVYLGRIPYSARERDIERYNFSYNSLIFSIFVSLSRFFSGYGKIKDIAIKFGFAFVEFDDDRDAEDACHDLNGKPMMGDS